MTPAVLAAKAAGIGYALAQYQHDPKAESYGDEAAEKLGVPAETIFKTLVVQSETKQLAVAIIPVSKKLNLKAAATALNSKKLIMADKQLVQRTTGYVLGGVSPLGQKNSLPTLIDDSAKAHPTIHVSAGRRGLEISLSPNDLAALTKATFVIIVQ